jgi:hypothetical protein
MPKKKVPEGKPERVTLKLTAAYCTPARNWLPDILAPYKVKNVVVRDKNQSDDYGNMWQDVEVDVNKQAAAWAEYLLLRSKKLVPNGKLFEEKNMEWASRRETMPKAWTDGSCEAAKSALKQAGKNKPAREKGKIKNRRKGTPAQTFKKIWDWL